MPIVGIYSSFVGQPTLHGCRCVPQAHVGLLDMCTMCTTALTVVAQ